MGMTGHNNLIYLNGIRGDAPGYLVEPFSLEQLRERARKQNLQPADAFGSEPHLSALKWRGDISPSFLLPAEAEPANLATTGWGLIFPAEAEAGHVDAILEALTELTALRAKQAGARYQVFRGPSGYRQGESGEEFLSRHDVQPGTPDVDKMPYCLLIIGDPQSIPFRFQYELDVQFSVGRLYFETLDEYANYARSVALSETPGQVQLLRQATFFGVAHDDDPPTQLSAKNLIEPLYQYAQEKHEKLGWNPPELVKPDQATKANLALRLGGTQTPALLFTASHGLGWPYGHALQITTQGAVVCQDWPGAASKTVPDRTMYFGAEDLDSQASLLGTVAFFFACFSGGTPYWDDYAVTENRKRRALAHRAFLAALPRRMLGLPRGGALAVIGHVERAWGYSFNWPETESDPASFKSALYQIMQGLPIGYAMEHLNIRYAQIATLLSNDFEELRYDPGYDAYKLSQHWLACNDARGYAILGDPAVRIPMAASGATAAIRPAIIGVGHRPGSLPMVMVPGSLPATEAPARTGELAQDAPAPAFTGGRATAAQASVPGATPPPEGGGQPGSAGNEPPIQDVVQGEAGATAAETTAPFASAMDGLTLALNTYARKGQLTFATGDESGVAFNVLDDAKNAVSNVVVNLNNALQNLSKRLVEATDEALTLEVTTSLVDDLDAFNPLKPDQKPRARFKTIVSATGDIQIFLPSRADPADAVLLQAQREMVAQAMSNRMELVKAVGELVASLFTPQK